MAQCPTTFLLKWGTSGTGNGQFSAPHNTDLDSAGNVYVTDSLNDRIQKFTSAGVYVTQWGASGSGNGQFHEPRGMAFNAGGDTLYVADGFNNRIQMFSVTGAYLGKWGSLGTTDGKFDFPSDVATDQAGHVFVVDSHNNRIQKFTRTGGYLAKWGSTGAADGLFTAPQGVATDAAGNVFVTEFTNHRVQKFTNSGQFILKWGVSGPGNGEFNRPNAVIVDAYGSVYVSDQFNHRIQKFTGTGVYQCQWGGAGSANGKFNNPNGVATDATGNLYVVDQSNNRVQMFTGVGWTIMASAGAGGTITPGGLVPVVSGANQAFTLNPAACHHVADVLVDGVSVGPVASYLFTGVSANHTIAASFALDSHTITASAGPGGVISPSGNVAAGCGTALEFTVDPTGCYQLADLIVDGVSLGALPGYTFSNITTNHTIAAVFSATAIPPAGLDLYGLTAIAGGVVSLVRINPTTAECTTIRAFGLGADLIPRSLTYDCVNDEFLVAAVLNTSLRTPHLIALTPTGTVTDHVIVGLPGGVAPIEGIEFDPTTGAILATVSLSGGNEQEHIAELSRTGQVLRISPSLGLGDRDYVGIAPGTGDIYAADFNSSCPRVAIVHDIFGSPTFTAVPCPPYDAGKGDVAFSEAGEMFISHPGGPLYKLTEGSYSLVGSYPPGFDIPHIAFGRSTSNTLPEASGLGTITVNRPGNGSGLLSVDCSTSSGTAQAGVDFAAVPTRLVWAPGDFTPKGFQVLIYDDSTIEGDEMFRVEMSHPGGGYPGLPASVVVTISDNDPVADSRVCGSDGPKILLHLATPTTKNQCAQGNIPCANAVVQGALYPSVYYAYALVTGVSAAAGIAGVQFGIDYGSGPLDNIGVDVIEWNPCGGPIEFGGFGPLPAVSVAPPPSIGRRRGRVEMGALATPAPVSGTGNMLVWPWHMPGGCQRTEPGGPGTGAVAVAGYFYVTAYSPARFSIVPRPVDSRAAVSTCPPLADPIDVGVFDVGPSNLGSIGFGGEPGYNPCAASATTPPPPASCAVTQGEMSSLFTWSPVPQATDFLVYRDGVLIADLPGGSTSYEDFPAPGSYVYSVRAATPCEASAACSASAGVSTAPDGPKANALMTLLPPASPTSLPVGISFELPAPSSIRLDIFDVGGRLIRELASETYAQGRHAVAWDGRDVQGRAMPSGLYFVRLVGPGAVRTQRVVVMRR